MRMTKMMPNYLRSFIAKSIIIGSAEKAKKITGNAYFSKKVAEYLKNAPKSKKPTAFVIRQQNLHFAWKHRGRVIG